MAITRRGAALAALLSASNGMSLFGGMWRSSNLSFTSEPTKPGKPYIQLTIPETTETYEQVPAAELDACEQEIKRRGLTGVACTDGRLGTEEVRVALEIRYKNRVARLSPDELMDALEGK